MIWLFYSLYLIAGLYTLGLYRNNAASEGAAAYCILFWPLALGEYHSQLRMKKSAPQPSAQPVRLPGLPSEAVPTTSLGNYSGYIWWLPACAASTEECEWCVRSYHPLDATRPKNGWAIRISLPK